MTLFNSIEKFTVLIKGSIVDDYFLKYLNEIQAKSFLIENDYIDKDFLIDYSNYYSRSFKEIPRKTNRIHFFSRVILESDFYSALEIGDISFFNSLQDAYLGFTVIKPILGKDEEPIIGRTLLKTYDTHSPGIIRSFIGSDYQVSLFGIPLSIYSLPFQTQDMAVGACATIACWTAIHQLSHIFNIHTSSPYELTDAITNLSYVLPGRNFPSINGLTISQMKSYFISLGLETEFVDPNINYLEHYEPSKDDVIADAVLAYQKIKLPLIAALTLKRTDEDEDYHAVVISGLRIEGGKITRLFIHDDRIGPFSRVKPVDNFSKWSNEWILKGSYHEVILDKLLIPVYPKIRLNFARIYSVFLEVKRNAEKEGIDSSLFLTTIRDYKEFLLHQEFDDKIKTLTQPMPKFLWIIRNSIDGKKLFDFVYDGTAVFANQCLMEISYHEYWNEN